MTTDNSSEGGTGATDPGEQAAGATSSGPETPRKHGDDDWRTRDRRALRKVAGLAVLLVFVYLIPDIFYRVLPGQAAVVWYLFAGGTDVDYVRPEGLRAKWPWNRTYVYDIRLQQVTRTFPALSNDGLPIEIEVSVRFRPHDKGLGTLHKHVGPDYVERLVVPELGAHVRQGIARYRPDQLYGPQREEIQQEILTALKNGLQLDYRLGIPNREIVVHVEDVLIRNIVLPPEVAAAIDTKLAQEQAMLEYDYRLQKEDKERQRKVIEAQGIREFQDIVTGGISERYLKWKGIDATLELARSPNAKIVVIGAGEDGLPIILGGLDSLPNVPPAAAGLAQSPAAPTPPAGVPPP